MRRACQVVLLAGSIVLLIPPAWAQAPEGRGGRRGEPRNMMGGGMIGMLLNNESVQKELKLDSDQVNKVKEAVEKVAQGHREDFAKLRDLGPEERRAKGQEIMQSASADSLKAVSDILNKDQMARLKQIELQRAGPEAFSRPDVAEALKLTPDQKSKIKTIHDDAMQELQQMRQGGGGRQRFQEIRSQTMEKAAAVLNDDQKKSWKEMTGEPFHLQLPNFQGGPRRGPRPAPPQDNG